jgi:hypothetical protein
VQRIFRGQQLADDLLALDDKEARGFAVLLVAQVAEAGELGFRQGHGASKAARAGFGNCSGGL